MLEMLLAIALLSAIVAATAAWTQVAASLVSPTGPTADARWSLAASAVLDLIQQDLQSGDFQPLRDAGTSKPKLRAIITKDELAIDTRTGGDVGGNVGGAARHQYRFDALKNQLTLVETPAGDSSAQHDRPLLSGVKEWTCATDIKRRCFDVSIAGMDGCTVTRRYQLQ